MSRQRPVSPPRCSEDELEAARATAVSNFVLERRGEGAGAYQVQLERCSAAVAELFSQSDDLRLFGGDLLADHPGLMEAARFLAAPPVSADDLDSLTGYSVSKRIHVGAEAAGAAASVLRALFDSARLPWLAVDRHASEEERQMAIAWTAGLWAAERQRTSRRTAASRRQKDAVFDAIEAAGFSQRPAPRVLTTFDDLPRGAFCGESTLDGAKCDVAVRLLDGRLLAIECKVSNSAVNSVKRLLRETGNKAQAWRNAFGQQVIPASVLSGVFKLANLLEAQNEYQIAIFWEHDLSQLKSFLSAAS